MSIRALVGDFGLIYIVLFVNLDSITAAAGERCTDTQKHGHADQEKEQVVIWRTHKP
jgi:hypothetical protein